MATGRIRRSARRGLAAAVLGWLGVAAFSVLMAPSAAAAPTATVEIRNVTPPVASVDAGGTVTFVNQIPAQNKGGITIAAGRQRHGHGATPTWRSASSARAAASQTGQSTAWTFNAPGDHRHDHLHLPDRPAGRPGRRGGQPGRQHGRGDAARAAGAVPYVVQTIAPNLPTLPSVNLPQLPDGERPAARSRRRVPPPRPPRSRRRAARRCRAPAAGSRRPAAAAARRLELRLRHRRRRPADVAVRHRGRRGVRPVPLLRRRTSSLGGVDRAGSGAGGAGGAPAATTAPRCRCSASSPASTATAGRGERRARPPARRPRRPRRCRPRRWPPSSRWPR